MRLPDRTISSKKGKEKDQHLPVSMALAEVMEPEKIKILKKLTKFGKMVESGLLDLDKVYCSVKRSHKPGLECQCAEEGISKR